MAAITRFHFLGMLAAEILRRPDLAISRVAWFVSRRMAANWLLALAPAQPALDKGCKDGVLALGIAQQVRCNAGKIATAPSIIALRQGAIQSR